MRVQWILVIVAIVGVVALVVWQMRRQPKEAPASALSQPADLSPAQTAPGTRRETFGPKSQWLAVRATSSDSVAKLIGLEEVRDVAWNEGVQTAYQQSHVFVTGSIDGWILALDSSFVGFSAEDLLDNPEILARWSSETGSEVLLFFCDRSSDSYGWLKAKNGKLERAYFEVEGESNLDVGEQTDEETRAREGAEGEELVFRLAKVWSIDPHTLDTKDSVPAVGLLGRIPE